MTSARKSKFAYLTGDHSYVRRIMMVLQNTRRGGLRLREGEGRERRDVWLANTIDIRESSSDLFAQAHPS